MMSIILKIMFGFALFMNSFSAVVIWRISLEAPEEAKRERLFVRIFASVYGLMAIGCLWLLTQRVVI
jgi:hypothetical protein